MKTMVPFGGLLIGNGCKDISWATDDVVFLNNCIKNVFIFSFGEYLHCFSNCSSFSLANNSFHSKLFKQKGIYEKT